MKRMAEEAGILIGSTYRFRSVTRYDTRLKASNSSKLQTKRLKCVLASKSAISDSADQSIGVKQQEGLSLLVLRVRGLRCWVSHLGVKSCQ
jgi:hypothetical protein